MRIRAAFAVLTLATMLGACSEGDKNRASSEDPSESAAPTTFDVRGSLKLAGAGNWKKSWDPCSGSDGYNDISGGAGVTIYDATGKAVALGSLESGRTVGWNCKFDFSVDDVPIQEGSTIYSVEVSHRGKIQFSQEDAQLVALTLG